LDLERRGLRDRGGVFRVGNKSKFSALGQYDMLCLLGMFSCFQPSLGARHEDLGSYFILEATDKAFSKEDICHTFCSKSQKLKCNNKNLN
jgi:hypothetical protein